MGKKKRKWFQKGAFEDGYQFGDIFRTIRATKKDIVTNLYEGAVGIVEDTIDAGAYIAGGVGGLFGADKFKDKKSKFIKKDIIHEEKVSDAIYDLSGGYLSDFVFGENDEDKNSVLGDKSDDLIKSGGQLAGQIGLQSVGVPWWVTTGVTGFGNGVEEALNEGANYGAAGLNGAITAGVEILSEKLFGGSGLGEKGIINTEPLTKWISNKAVKTFADYGVDMLAEGTEEVFSQFAGNLSSSIYKRGKLKDILFSKEAAEGYIESFIGGAVLSGFANGKNVGKSAYNRTDYRNGLTKNEQKVFERAYGEKIVESKIDNDKKRLTGKQKARIYTDTLQQVKNGNITSNIIESSLGGEDYKTYKNITDNYDILERELRELETEESEFKTQEQILKQQNIKQRLEQIKTKTDGLKGILQNKVIEKIDADNIHLKGRESYLLESYTKQLSELTDNALNDDITADKYNYKIPESTKIIKDEQGRKGVASQGEATPFKIENLEFKVKNNGSDIMSEPHITESDGIRTIGADKNINEDAFVEGMWQDSPNTTKSTVEKGRLHVVDNDIEKRYNDESAITDGSHLSEGKLKPNVKYKSGEYDYIYVTDELCRISDVHAEQLYCTKRDRRLKHNSNTLGKQIGDHAGHLIGDRFGGSPNLDNLVSQTKLVNLSEYKQIENIWSNALNSGQKVGVDIKIQYDGNNIRPKSFIIYYTIDGVKFKRIVNN